MRILKKLHFFLFVVCLFGIGQAFAAWDGTSKTQPVKEGDYYIINTEAELAWYAANYSNWNARLNANLDLGGHLWIPIAPGQGNARYAKIFDGNGHVIKNLYINGTELAQIDKNYAQNLGFVGTLGGGTIKNLILENVDIQASTNAGDILGRDDSQISVGAFVGWMADKVTKNVVENCVVASGTIRTTGNGQGVGGIVGNAKVGTITNCMSLVEIHTSGSQAYIGGIIGITKTDVTVASCVYAGPGLVNTGSNGAVGGITGNVYSGKMTATDDYYEGENYYQDSAVGGVGKSCGKNCTVHTESVEQVSESNQEEVVCVLNGIDSTTGACKTEPWSLGETGLSLNGYGIDGYKIVFDANGGAFANGKADKDKFLQAGMAITADEVGVPSRENHNFVGWAMTRDATAPAADLGTVSQTDTVFAVWAPVYTVTFDVAPGVFPESGESVKTKQVAQGDLITVEGLGTLPTSRCKTYVSGTEGECATYSYFTGWALTEGGDTVSLDTVAASDELVLYAAWTDVETYTVTYNANQHGRTTVDYVRVGAGDTVTAPTDPIADSGYKFDGWFTDAEGENPYQFAAQIHESIILYAKWALDTFTVTYEMNGVSNAGENPVFYTIETPTFALTAPADVEGYVFEGWFYDANFTNPASQVIQGTTGDKTFYAKWTKTTYRIMYLADNNSQGAVTDQFKEHGTPITLESAGHFNRKGYPQVGWATDTNGVMVYEFSASYEENAALTLYPAWGAPIVYTITYVCDGCTDNTGNKTSYTVETATFSVKSKGVTPPEGYKMAGWYSATDYKTKVEQIKKGSVGDMTLYAKLNKIYHITYVLNGSANDYNPDDYTVDDGFTLNDPAPVEGFTFGGWFTNAEFEGDSVTEIVTGSTGDITLYAKWIPDEPVVTQYGGITVTTYSDGTASAEIDDTSFETVEITTDVVVNSISFSRVFSNGKMSTVMFPFSIDTSEVAGGKFYELVEFSNEGSRWTATAQEPEAGTIVANKPYLLMPTANGTLSFNLKDPVTFNTSNMQPTVIGNWEFKGTYSYHRFTTDDPEFGRAYGFAAAASNGIEVGQFVKAGSGAWLRPMRAYLVNNSGKSGGLTRSASARRVMDVSELPETIDLTLKDNHGNVVGTGTLNTRTGEFKANSWFDLRGRRLNGKPTTKGTYYNNGRKVIIK
ncbi:MAG: InlB B-repeat-containing protein [Fibrobacter sp.]|uniref:InlB B-repeat-containing protein n=1 Tax=Fibrobacter sp. TaxID=35828 RepID=UPI001B278A99|nr:InlB B-repeat-containing protein [Fibrobacter sp.]MBO7061796.1 InlB B-repeat-containing protein [Fibrobacter sp.]